MAKRKAKPSTSWRIVGWPDATAVLEASSVFPGGDLTLSVPSDKPEVLEALEDSAARHGIVLERIAPS